MIDKKKAFVIMPFRKPYDGYFFEIYVPALESAGFLATKADDLFVPRPIMEDIRAKILESELLLCEMSGRNPNVFYELGLAHAIGRPAILIANSKKDIPFDLQHVRTIIYDTRSAGWESKLKLSIAEAAREVTRAKVTWPSPLVMPDDQAASYNIPGIDYVFPNLPSCEQEILNEISASKTVRIFLQLGKTVLVGTPTIYDHLEKSIQAGTTVKILHAGINNRYLNRRIAIERGSSYEGWTHDIMYITRKLQDLRRRSTGVIQSSSHDEAYYWLIFLFDYTVYVQPYIYDKQNTSKAPVLKIRAEGPGNANKSLYWVFDRYFNRKWDESLSSIVKVDDLYLLNEIKVENSSVAGVLVHQGLYVFVVPSRYVYPAKKEMQFHATGGKIRPGESLTDALIREIQEEIDCKVKVLHAKQTLLMSNHLDIGQLHLQDNPAPSYIYKRTRSDSISYGNADVWLFAFNVQLLDENPQPCGEIAAIIFLSKRLLLESVSRKLKIKELLNARDGSALVTQSDVVIDEDMIVLPAGLASIIAAIEYEQE